MSAEFDNALNSLMGGLSRPKKDEDIKALESFMDSVVELCGDDESKWKSLVLALTYKRYHLKAPEAKISLKEALADKKSDTKTTVGNGERRIFYVAITHLFQKLLNDAEANDLVSWAIDCLIQIAPLAGGSRDVCSLIEAFVGAVMHSNESFLVKRQQCIDLFGKESLSLLVPSGVKLCMDGIQNDKAQVALNNLLQVAADTLDEDKSILLQARAKGDGDKDEKDTTLPSTLHMFVPHRDRGKPRNKKTATNAKTIPNRQLHNTVAELLIWSRTSLMSSNKAFAGSYNCLLESSSESISNDIKVRAKRALQCLHTIIRKERKQFNDFARKEGFMLSDLFPQDHGALKYQQIVRGKDGDINKLTKLATKGGATNVLTMITTRFASNPSKITHFESVQSLVQDWSNATKLCDDEQVAKKLKEIQLARLKATIRQLRQAYKRSEREIVLASLDSTVESHAAALLIAAALGKWEIDSDSDVPMPDTSAPVVPVGCNLHLPGGVVHTVDCFQEVCDLLMSIVSSDPLTFPSMTDDDGSATIKAVVNMVERYLKENQTLLAVSSNDLKLPPETIETIVKRNCSIHRHDVDDLQERLNREGAKNGDITISLSWDTHDDLDLHVFVPCGEEVSYANRVCDKGKANLDVDMNASGPYSNAPVENVFVGDLDKHEEAPHGKYRVVVQNYSYHAKGAKNTTEIPWQVVVDKNGVKEKFTGNCVGTSKESDVIACEFEYTGRTVPYEEKEQPAELAARTVNITTSVGRTLEALTQAIKAVGQQEHMDQVRQLVIEDEHGEQTVERLALSATYEVTNRDRNNMLIFHLPARFQAIVNKVFGGGDLSDNCAESIAKRMVEDKIPISELKRAGYPDDIVESVREKMKVV
ncbi:unnamed protein product [Cylindrotheca closterium]|uniref:Uncharacterized protein n=1 Tax=Cylindrotheca closterium TaxID=2856 RepID=A0AAD2JLQ9_9STRA|nr:unnamed protein product [Cylindrotheca closterium]